MVKKEILVKLLFGFFKTQNFSNVDISSTVHSLIIKELNNTFIKNEFLL